MTMLSDVYLNSSIYLFIHLLAIPIYFDECIFEYNEMTFSIRITVALW